VAVTEENLNQAITRVINAYAQLPLQRVGLGQVRLRGWYEVGTVSAELTSEYHIRYGGYGGIGYYLVADSYIALFSRFSPHAHTPTRGL
jgi:hypothetical protein